MASRRRAVRYLVLCLLGMLAWLASLLVLCSAVGPGSDRQRASALLALVLASAWVELWRGCLSEVLARHWEEAGKSEPEARALASLYVHERLLTGALPWSSQGTREGELAELYALRSPLPGTPCLRAPTSSSSTLSRQA